MEVWRRTHVFTSDDISYFLASTDAERKKFLEQMMGLDQFIPAFKQASAELKAATEELEQRERELASKLGALEALEKNAGEKPDGAAPPKPDVTEIKEIRRILRETTYKNSAHADRAAALRHDIRRLEAWVEEMGDGTCPTCKQDLPVDKALIKKTRRELAEAKQARDEAASLEKEAYATWRDQRDKLQARLDELEESLDEFEAYHAEVTAAEKAAARVAEAAREVGRAERARTQAQEKQEHLKDCAAALSPKGVRAWVVGQALDTISRRANEFLAVIGSHIKVELTGSLELKNGEVRDEIGLKLHAAGGGKYKGASQGERQRVAICVRLAIAEVAGSGGTLFLDEAFSNIDDKGVDGVVEVVKLLSQSRCVVVITHNQRMAKALGGKHLHFS